MFTSLKHYLLSFFPAISKGKLYENKARKFLQRQGLRDFQINYYSRMGEIDLIARQGDVLVFIEVRYREHQEYGTAIETVGFQKQQRIRRTAQHFLQKNCLTNKTPCRFDVVGISGSADRLKYQWIKNAF
jgi:putative endonuclease